ncbi:MAG: NAD(P)H-dependent glycerol-3-phosphate dehydrogenase [Gemmatimonadota bacterium]
MAVLGAGSWGTALADLLARNGHPVRVWAHDPRVAEEMRRSATNSKHLPGIRIADGVCATPRLEEAVSGAEVLVSATPSHVVREVVGEARRWLDERSLVVSASKGLEIESGKCMSEVLAELLGDKRGKRIAVLSGPSFAVELSRRLPTAVTVASREPESGLRVQRLFQNEHFRLYTQSDVIGTELGGALKNVIAIAAGISDGLQLGDNARAALITRGLAEISRLARKMGGEEPTLAGLAGAGDLILTCTGDLSRNRRVGLAIGRGRRLEEVLAETTSVAEGVRTTRAARDLAAAHGVEMPIVAAVYSILYEDVEPRHALAELMAREPKPERWS